MSTPPPAPAPVPPETDVPSGSPSRVPTPHPGDPRLQHLSMNQATIPQWSVGQLVDGCARAGVPAVGLWREPIQAMGLPAAAKRVRDAGLQVSSLCRGGFLTVTGQRPRAQAIADNRRAIDEAAELGTSELAMVVGGLPDGSRDLRGARERVADGLAELAPYAASRGVRLALEPLHPMFCADRAVVCTLRQALDLADLYSAAQVGVVVDAYHVWWDPELDTQIRRAGTRIGVFQVGDWIWPLRSDPLRSRAMMGDGSIDLGHLRQLVGAAGHAGRIEVEIFNYDLGQADGGHVLRTVLRRFVEHVR